METNYITGQPVQLLHGSERGVVERVLPGGQVLVMLEGGLAVELDAGEVMPLHAMVRTVAAPAQSKPIAPVKEAARKAQPQAALRLPVEEGLYLAVEDEPEAWWLVNATHFDVQFSLFESGGGSRRGLRYGMAPPQGRHALPKPAEDEQWEVQALFFSEKAHQPRPPLQAHYRLKRAQLEAVEKRFNPLSGKAALWLPLAGEPEPAEQPAAAPAAPEPVQKAVHRKPLQDTLPIPPAVVDLHIQKLAPGARGLDNFAMLHIQMAHFQKMLAAAQEHRMPHITFIHGIGNGRLKDDMHRYLAKQDKVSDYYVDDSGRYGGGATRVVLERY